MTIWKLALEQFLGSPDKIRLVYGSMNHLITPLTQRLLILDSSFNPPHKGHYSMIRGAITRSTNEMGVSCINTSSVILMLSVNNVDKPGAGIDEYVKRLELIQAMAQLVENELGLQCGICISKCGLFVDKSKQIRFMFGNHIKCDYLLGFDTLIRLFDGKYYPNGNVKLALDDFIGDNKLVTFIRDDGKMSIDEQRQYISSIGKGQIMGIPSNWLNQIEMLEMKDFWWISSSEIRRLQQSRDPKWREMVIT